MMFAQRNWNALEDWCNYLNYQCKKNKDKKGTKMQKMEWGNFVNERKKLAVQRFLCF